MKASRLTNYFGRAFNAETSFLYGTRVGAILLRSFGLIAIAAFIDVGEFGRFTFMFSASQVVAVLVGAGAPLFLQRVLPARDISYGGKGNTRIVVRCLLRTLNIGAFTALVLSALWFIGEGVGLAEFSKEAFLILLTGLLVSCLHTVAVVVRVARSATLSMLYRDALPYLLFLIGVSAAVPLGFDSAEYILGLFCGAVGVVAGIAAISANAYLRERTIRKNGTDLHNETTMSFWGSAAAGVGLAQFDILLGRIFLDDRALGIYAVMRWASNLVSMPQVIANWTINVRVAEDFERRDTEALARHAVHGLLLALPVATLLFLVLMALSPVWLSIFEIETNATNLATLTILLSAQMVNVLSGANALFATQCREEGFILKARGAALTVGCSGVSLGAFFAGSIGIAMGAFIAIALVNILLLHRIKKRINVWTSIPLTLLGRKGQLK